MIDEDALEPGETVASVFEKIVGEARGKIPEHEVIHTKNGMAVLIAAAWPDDKRGSEFGTIVTHTNFVRGSPYVVHNFARGLAAELIEICGLLNVNPVRFMETAMDDHDMVTIERTGDANPTKRKRSH